MAKKRKSKKRKVMKANAPKLRSVGRHGTGWIDARRVKIERHGRRTTVLIQKGAKRKR